MNNVRSGATYLHWQREPARLLERPGPRTQHLNAEVNCNTQATMCTHLWHPLLLHFITMPTETHRGNSGTHCCYILLQCQLEHTGNNVYTAVSHTTVTFHYNANCFCCKWSCTCTRVRAHTHTYPQAHITS